MNKPEVKLVGEDGNAFFILGRVETAMKNHAKLNKGYDYKLEYDTFYKEATSGDYENLLRTVMKYCNVDTPSEEEDELEEENRLLSEENEELRNKIEEIQKELKNKSKVEKKIVNYDEDYGMGF